MNSFNEQLNVAIDGLTPPDGDGLSKRLPVSSVGDSCARAMWYSFRWFARKSFPPRMRRLLKRGEREEAVFAEHFRKLGATVWTHDSNGDQFRVSFFGDHMAGKLDGAIKDILGLKTPLLLEMKSSNEKHFNKLEKEGLDLAKPEHRKQMLVYMHGFNFKQGVYASVCKNDDRLYFKLVDYDATLVRHLLLRAGQVIFGEAPARISEDANYYECKWCTFYDVCHKGATPLKNCRTCQFSSAKPEGGWNCGKGRQEIESTPKVGCEEYQRRTL